MFSSKKSGDKGLPDLPPLKTLPGIRPRIDLSREEKRVDDGFLPSFPSSVGDHEMSRTAIRDTVGGNDGIRVPAISERENGKYGVVEMEEWEPSDQEESEEFLATERGSIQPPHSHYDNLKKMPVSGVRGREPSSADVFVQLDRFHAARRALSDVKHTLSDIDELIKRIRETKLREEQEIAAWEKDVEHIKSRVHDVTENIFEKVE